MDVEEKFKAREVQPTVLRLHPDVRAQLMRIATVNGRSLTKEIESRLRESLVSNVATHIKADPAAPVIKNYKADPLATVVTTNENGLTCHLTDSDQAILNVFRALPVEKQLALLSLFK
jgi:hypothetical protein